VKHRPWSRPTHSIFYTAITLPLNQFEHYTPSSAELPTFDPPGTLPPNALPRVFDHFMNIFELFVAGEFNPTGIHIYVSMGHQHNESAKWANAHTAPVNFGDP